MYGKRMAGEVKAESAPPSDVTAPQPAQPNEPAAVGEGEIDREERWWLQVSVGNYRLRALYDTGASRTVMGTVDLQIATVLGRPLTPSYGRCAKVVGGHTATIAGYVELPFEVVRVKRELRVEVVPDDAVDCYLGVNFARAFGAMHDPVNNQLVVTASGKRVDLEIAGVALSEPLAISSVGLEEMTDAQRREMMALEEMILGGSDEALGCTSWMKHHIDVGSARPIKRRYHSVSKKLEEDLHRQVIEML